MDILCFSEQTPDAPISARIERRLTKGAGTLIGVSMLFSGITRLMLSLAVRRAVA